MTDSIYRDGLVHVVHALSKVPKFVLGYVIIYDGCLPTDICGKFFISRHDSVCHGQILRQKVLFQSQKEKLDVVENGGKIITFWTHAV